MVTEAPPTNIPVLEPDDVIAALRRQLEGRISVSATVVQDRLLDLWGALPEGDGRVVVERWLTETLERNLYSVTDVDSRLDAVLAARN